MFNVGPSHSRNLRVPRISKFGRDMTSLYHLLDRNLMALPYADGPLRVEVGARADVKEYKVVFVGGFVEGDLVRPKIGQTLSAVTVMSCYSEMHARYSERGEESLVRSGLYDRV